MYPLPLTLLLLCCHVCWAVQRVRQFEYCLMFRGTCKTFCGDEPDLFPLLGVNWCLDNRLLCCIKIIRPTTTIAAPTPTTATSSTPTTRTTTSSSPSTSLTTIITTTSKAIATSAVSPSMSTKPSAESSTVDLSSSLAPPSTTTAAAPRCGVAVRGRRPSSRIVGGAQAERCELPWLVHIALAMGPCGGALLDDRHVLTAAHCFSNIGSFTPKVIIGEYNTSEDAPSEKFSTTDYKIIVHPQYNYDSYFHDIAILRLNTRIDYNSYKCVTPLCLPPPGASFEAGADCLVAGWGVTVPKYLLFNPPVSPVLLKVSLPVVDEALCVKKFGTYYNRTIQTCAGHLEGTKDSCDGDSGGPLMCRVGPGSEVYAAGIISSGSGCAQVQTPAIYTDVTAFLPWIYSVVGG